MYQCQYCGVSHEDETEAVEHIVPRVFRNDRLKLHGTCRRWNNFFACSFESRLISSDFMREVLSVADPAHFPRGRAVYLGRVKTSRGTTEHRWWKDGKQTLHDMPQYETTRKLSLPAFDRQDNAQEIEIELPFEITFRATGAQPDIEKIRRRQQKKLKKEKAKLLEYLGRLADDPQINPGVAKTLQERNLILRRPQDAQVKEQLAPKSPSEVVSDILPALYPIDRETWMKFYLKIAWCYACKLLGSTALQAIGGDLVLDYLKFGSINAMDVATCRAHDEAISERAFRTVKIEGEDVWLWNCGVADALPMIAPVADVGVRSLLTELLNGRKNTEDFFACWVHFEEPGNLDEEAQARLALNRFHKLGLKWVTTPAGLAALVCSVELFSGVFRASVQVTPLAPVPDVLARLRVGGRAVEFLSASDLQVDQITF